MYRPTFPLEELEQQLEKLHKQGKQIENANLCIYKLEVCLWFTGKLTYLPVVDLQITGLKGGECSVTTQG